jgi:hypothetical protein
LKNLRPIKTNSTTRNRSTIFMSLDNPFLLGVSMHLQGNDDGVGFGVKGTSLNNTGVLGTSNNRAGVFGSSIGARWLKRLHHFTRLSALLTIVLVVAGAKAQPPNGFNAGQRIGAVSRSPDTLDVFAADIFGAIYHARWDPSPGWQGWYNTNGGQSQTIFSSPIGPVNAVSTFPGELDLFSVASNFHVYTTRYFDPYFNYGGWSQIGDLSADPEAYVSAVSRSTDKWDIFVAGNNGDDQVWTAASGVGVWRPLPGIHVLPNTPVAAASPVTDQLNIFVVDAHGNLQASVWAPYLGGWTSWRQIGGVQLYAGEPVTAISRGSGQLELFVTDVNGNIQTTTVYPSFSGWKSIGVAASGSTVTGVSRHPGQLDLFVVLNQQVWTQGSPSLSSGFNSNSWRPISGLTTAEWGGSAVTAVSRNLDKLDVFVIGLDFNLWTAAWEPDFVQPGVSDWHVFQVQLPYGLPAFP